MTTNDPFVSNEPIRTEAVRPANVKWKIKGNADGPIYAGTVQVKPCVTCGAKEKTATPQR